jgi:hypothetical protein
MLSAAFIPLALALIARANLGKTALFSDGLYQPLIGLNNMAVPSTTITSVAVPSICTQHASASGCNTSAVQAFSVKYGDCAEAWTLCRCGDATME